MTWGDSLRQLLLVGMSALAAAWLGCRGDSFSSQEGLRPTLGWLAGQPEYAAYDPRKVGPSVLDSTSELGLRANAYEALERAAWDQAITSLKQQDDFLPLAHYHNDLSVALFEKGVRENDPLALIEATHRAGLAAQADPTYKVALFNRALFLTRLGLRQTAQQAWMEFVSRANEGGWRAEAEHEMGALRVPSRRDQWDQLSNAVLGGSGWSTKADDLVQRFPFQSRRMVERELLSSWAKARRAGDDSSAQRLWKISEGIASALAASRGDYLLADGLAAIDAGTAEPEDATIAHQHLSTGVQSFFAHRSGDAATVLAKAAESLRRFDSPFAVFAEYLVWTARHEDDHDQAYAALVRLLEETDVNRYPSLAGRVAWQLGIIAARQDRLEVARGHYEKGNEWMTASSGPDGAHFGHVLLGSLHDQLGDQPKAFQHFLIALAAVTELGEEQGVHSMLVEIIHSLVGAGRPELAIPFARELEANARGWAAPIADVEAQLQLGRLLAAANQAEEARQTLESAQEAALALPSGALRTARLQEIELDLAMVHVEIEPVAAVGRITKALSVQEASGRLLRRLSAMRAKADALCAIGQTAECVRTLSGAIDYFELRRSTVTDPRSRAFALREAQRIADDLAVLALAENSPGGVVRAMAATERVRSRFLLDRLQSVPQGDDWVAIPRAVQKALSVEQMLVEYLVAGDRVLAWTLSSEGIDWVELAERASSLSRKVERLRQLVLTGDSSDELSKLQRTLFRELVAPLFERKVPRQLVVVPDRFLFDLPFDMLADPETERYLGAETALSTAPSAAVWLWGELAKGQERPKPSMIAIAPRHVASELPRLPFVEDEARSVASQYSSGAQLLGTDATAHAARVQMPQFDIVHFSGHAVSNPNALGRSFLALASDADNPSGHLFAGSLMEVDLSKTQTVVLASCSTTDGFQVDREALMGIAGAILAAGARCVVATRWPVVDEGSNPIVLGLHRHLALGDSPAVALQKTREELRPASPGTPSLETWGNYFALGNC